MTFEEAIEIIEEECGIEEGNGFFTNERDLDPFLAIAIVRNLEDTYALKNWQRVKSSINIYYTANRIYPQEENRMYQLRIFESDNAMTQVGRLRFTTRDDMDDVFIFLLGNNENNKWEFELVDKQGGQIGYYEYIEAEEGDYSFREYENE